MRRKEGRTTNRGWDVINGRGCTESTDCGNVSKNEGICQMTCSKGFDAEAKVSYLRSTFRCRCQQASAPLPLPAASAASIYHSPTPAKSTLARVSNVKKRLISSVHFLKISADSCVTVLFLKFVYFILKNRTLFIVLFTGITIPLHRKGEAR